MFSLKYSDISVLALPVLLLISGCGTAYRDIANNLNSATSQKAQNTDVPSNHTDASMEFDRAKSHKNFQNQRYNHRPVSLFDSVEQTVAKLIDDFLLEFEQCQNIANPLQKKEPDVEAFKKNLKAELDKLLGKEIEIQGEVAGFLERDGAIKVAFIAPGFFKNPFLGPASIRIRVDGDAAMETASGSSRIAKPMSLEYYQTPEYLQQMKLLSLGPFLNRLSSISMLAETENDLSREDVAKFEIGSLYSCNLRVTAWELVTTNQQENGMFMFSGMALMGFAETPEELQAMNRAIEMPFVELTCEFIKR